MATIIYALCDPDLQIPVIRYIGKTTNLVKRASSHRRTSIKAKTHLGCWLRSLKNRGEKPVLMTLTEVPDEIGSAAEILYIRLAREGGMDLVNTTDGGEGTSCPRSPEARAATSKSMTGVPKSLEHRSNISAGKKGVPKSPEHRAALSASLMGVPLSPERCATLSAAMTSERRAAMSASRKGVPKGPYSPEHCAAISAGKRVSWALRRMPHFNFGEGI